MMQMIFEEWKPWDIIALKLELHKDAWGFMRKPDTSTMKLMQGINAWVEI
jgi:hypothetical protein